MPNLFCKLFVKVLSKGFFVESLGPISQAGPKRGNPTMTTSTDTDRRKGDPQHYVEGKINPGSILAFLHIISWSAIR